MRPLSVSRTACIGAALFLLIAGLPAFGQEQEGALGVGARARVMGDFTEVASRVQPVVVQINVVSTLQQPQQPFPFDFPSPFGPGPGGQPPRRQGLGSGVIVRQDGDTVYVLTNNHVVGEAEEISILTHDQRTITGTLVGKDPRVDLALVQFTSTARVPVARLGDSDQVRVGEWVLAVGNPFGLESTVTAGIISAVGRTGGPEGLIADFIQTDAAINPGNSGGALINERGEVIGINTWIASTTGTYTGIGFAVPINYAKRAIDQLIATGRVEYGWLGISVRDPWPQAREDLGLGERGGALAINVYLGSPADRAGILPGDFIIRISGQEAADIHNANELVRVVGALPPGQPAQFSIIRYGEQRTLSVQPVVREEEQIPAQNRRMWPGMLVLTGEEVPGMRLSRADVVVAQVYEGTPAGIGGIQPGDVIQAISGRRVASLLDYFRNLNQAREPVRFELLRQGQRLEIGLRKGG